MRTLADIGGRDPDAWARHCTETLPRALDARGCLRCGATDDLTFDHIVPRMMSPGNCPHTLQVLCRRCNSFKSDRWVFYAHESNPLTVDAWTQVDVLLRPDLPHEGQQQALRDLIWGLRDAARPHLPDRFKIEGYEGFVGYEGSVGEWANLIVIACTGSPSRSGTPMDAANFRYAIKLARARVPLSRVFSVVSEHGQMPVEFLVDLLGSDFTE